MKYLDLLNGMTEMTDWYFSAIGQQVNSSIPSTEKPVIPEEFETAYWNFYRSLQERGLSAIVASAEDDSEVIDTLVGEDHTLSRKRLTDLRLALNEEDPPQREDTEYMCFYQFTVTDVPLQHSFERLVTTYNSALAENDLLYASSARKLTKRRSNKKR